MHKLFPLCWCWPSICPGFLRVTISYLFNDSSQIYDWAGLNELKSKFIRKINMYHYYEDVHYYLCIIFIYDKGIRIKTTTDSPSLRIQSDCACRQHNEAGWGRELHIYGLDGQNEHPSGWIVSFFHCYIESDTGCCMHKCIQLLESSVALLGSSITATGVPMPLSQSTSNVV